MATVNKLLEEIDADVADTIATDFIYTPSSVVPNRQDIGLTYGRGAEKRGIEIDTCVLYVDIRNSVDLTHKHQHKTMGKIYSVFTKAVLKIAQHHGGHIRNIIGDRVMVVFPVENCFVKAVDCAISINHVAKYIINKRFPLVDFKCGIGIDYGKMRVLKIGAQRKGPEGGESKALVWVGNPANIASRLTDHANKIVKETFYHVKRNPKNFFYNIPNYLFGTGSLGMGGIGGIGGMGLQLSNSSKSEPEFLDIIDDIEMTPEEFANSFGLLGNQPYFKEGRLINFEKKERSYNYGPILMTNAVYSGFSAANPIRNSVKNKFWNKINHNIKNVSDPHIYSGDVIWTIN